MYRMWKGVNAKVALMVTGTVVALISIYIHIFAFHVTGYPSSAVAKYNPPAVASK